MFKELTQHLVETVVIPLMLLVLPSVVEAVVDPETLDIHSLIRFLLTIMVVFLDSVAKGPVFTDNMDQVVEVDKEIVDLLRWSLDKVVPLVAFVEVEGSIYPSSLGGGDSGIFRW